MKSNSKVDLNITINTCRSKNTIRIAKGFYIDPPMPKLNIWYIRNGRWIEKAIYKPKFNGTYSGGVVEGYVESRVVK